MCSILFKFFSIICTFPRLNTKGEEIIGASHDSDRPKYVIKLTPNHTILKINHLNIEDMGEYSLQAVNQDKFEMLNFTLDVIGKSTQRISTFHEW